jgi:hypothetical protein
MQSEKLKWLKRLQSKVHRKGGNDVVMTYMFYKHAESIFDDELKSRQGYHIHATKILDNIKSKLDEKGNINLSDVDVPRLKLNTDYATISMIEKVSKMFHLYWVEPGVVMPMFTSIAREQLKINEREENNEVHSTDGSVTENSEQDIDNQQE